MILNRKEYIETDGSVGYIESIFDSSNILKTTYFPKMNRLYIAFSRGTTYSYGNLDMTMYTEFENAESQGTFLNKNINRNTMFPYRKEFTLYPEEIKEIKFTINETKNIKANESKSE
jgi:hypothetical protein